MSLKASFEPFETTAQSDSKFAIDCDVSLNLNLKASQKHPELLEMQSQDVQSKDESSSDAPIGLFDSGVGGLSVYMHLKKVLPDESYVYYADLLHVPYGHRSSEDITRLTLAAVDWLVAIGCKLVVIACNSASAHALEVARRKYPNIPIVGLVPALKPAVMFSQSKNVAVLATRATLEGALLNDVIKQYAVPAKVNVIKYFNPDLVPWVEAGMQTDSETARQLKSQLHDFAKQHIDYLVLGCTHYPFFKDFVMEEIAQHNLGIAVVDSGAAIASRVKELLSAQQKFAKRTETIISSVNNVNSAPKHNNNHDDNADDIYFDAIPCGVDLSLEASKVKQAIPAKIKLAFFATSDTGSLEETSKLVKRLVIDSAEVNKQ